jgi:hypothetical protein
MALPATPLLIATPLPRDHAKDELGMAISAMRAMILTAFMAFQDPVVF